MESRAVRDVQWFETRVADKAKGATLYGHKAGGKGWTMSSLDYKVPVRARSYRQPSFLLCLCGWAQPSTCGSGGSPRDLSGPWRLPAVAFNHSALFCLHKILPNQKGNTVQMKQVSGKHPIIIREAPDRTQPPGQTQGSSDHQSSSLAPPGSPESSQRSKGTMEPKLPSFLLRDGAATPARVRLHFGASPQEMQQP